MKIRHSMHGFTLVELLVVIGIIAVLAGILMPVLSRARVTSNELISQSDLRQMLIGYGMYQQDNHGSVLFGYTPPAVSGINVTVTDPVSQQVFGSPIADRYPWRLAPYVADMWQIIHSYGDLPALPQPGDSAANATSKAYSASLNPTYGINSVYVGGDTNYGGFSVVGSNPNTGKYIVFKASEVRHSSQLIVFTDCRCFFYPGLVAQGFYSVTPPRAGGQMWSIVDGQLVFNYGATIGAPKGWYSDRVMVGFFDGHVDSMLPADLQDMRLWANWADSPTYDYALLP